MEFVTSIPGSDPIIVEGYLSASPSQVFDAWTNPDIVMQWFGITPNSIHSASVDLRKGGIWKFLKTKNETKSVGFEGNYLDIQPDRKLVFSWSLVTVLADGTREATPPSRVEVEFTPKGEGTHVRLKHSSFHNEESSIGFGRGWNIAFGSLSTLLDTSSNSNASTTAPSHYDSAPRRP